MTHAYESLTPDLLLQALDSVGFYSDGSLLALNSYENRVYAFRDDDKNRFVVKFYRPERWSAPQIQEEHTFLAYLQQHEIDVIAPLVRDGLSLFSHQQFHFAVFPQRGGRALDTSDVAQLEMIGRTVGRLHAVAASFKFLHRPQLTVDQFATPALQQTLNSKLLPNHLLVRYEQTAEKLLQRCRQRYQSLPDLDWLSCHGDMHIGNILWTGDNILLCDFDDARTAPAIQDLWMLAHNQQERDILIAEYETFYDFDWRQWPLVEIQRSLRMIQYTGWLATRWSDPTFPRHFPWFGSESYFVEQIHAFEKQMELLDE